MKVVLKALEENCSLRFVEELSQSPIKNLD